MSVALQMGQGHDRHQVTHVKAGGAGVKTYITSKWPLQRGADATLIRSLFNKASFGQHVECVFTHANLLHSSPVMLTHYTAEAVYRQAETANPNIRQEMNL